MTPDLQPEKPVDFSRVETLRKHLLLSKREIAALFDVSHVTYYGWVSGKPLRKSNVATVRKQLKKLLAIITEHNWPTPEARALSGRDRLEKLRKLLETYN